MKHLSEAFEFIREKLKKEKKFTQDEVAKLFSMSIPNYTKIAKGKSFPGVDKIYNASKKEELDWVNWNYVIFGIGKIDDENFTSTTSKEEEEINKLRDEISKSDKEAIDAYKRLIKCQDENKELKAEIALLKSKNS